MAVIIPYIISKYCEIIFESPINKSFYFGYYNYLPLSIDNNLLLAHHVSFENRIPNANDFAEVGFFEIKSKKWYPIAKTNSFNWQQGSMLQWLGPDFNSKIIYNYCKDNHYIARIIDINHNKIIELPKAIYGVHPNGETSITLNFERANFTRAYSYYNFIDKSWDKRISEKDGIILLNHKLETFHTIISLQEFLKKYKITDDGSTYHWFEHIFINPSGNRFAFYYRYGDSKCFSTRIFTSDLIGNDIWEFPNKNNDSLSHMCWKDDSNFIIYKGQRSFLNKLWIGASSTPSKEKIHHSIYRKYLKKYLKKYLPKEKNTNISYYALTCDKLGIVDKIKMYPNIDGHPSFSKDKRFILTDTYADSDGYRNLLLYDTNKEKTYRLAKFFSPYNNVSWRADLHPRFSFDNQYIVVDSAHNGYHQIIVLKLFWDAIL